MTSTIPRTETKINARELRIRFSPAVQEYFHDLAEVAATSPHFSPEMVSLLQDWSVSKASSVHDVMIAMPSIAEQMAEHVSKTHDRLVLDLWNGLCTQLPENGFSVSQSRQTGR